MHEPWKKLALLGLLVIALAIAPAAMADETLLQQFQEAHQEDALYRNAVYLYLRIAGALWIAIEWIAAIILWRAYRHLAAAVARSEEVQ